MFFFFNDTATTEIYTLSLHDALPISPEMLFPGIMAYLVLILMGPAYNCFAFEGRGIQTYFMAPLHFRDIFLDRKSTRLNSSHGYISYAVFCLKKKKTISTHALCRLHL